MKILKIILIASALFFTMANTSANDENTGAGTVAETIKVGAYVYVRLEEDGSWVAATAVPVAVGDQVNYAGGAMMKDFHSSTLDRTFESILFVMNLEVVRQVNADTHADTVANDPHGEAKNTVLVAPSPGEITPIDGGKTIAEIQAEHFQLKDQKVSLRARVMKVSPDILGKNWFTLQDGTGTAPEDKLIASSSELAETGELLTVTGVVRNDVDLGSGYLYKVLLEEATFSR